MEFKKKVSEVLEAPLISAGLKSLQVNVGYICNMSCKHCHVAAGPNRLEVMEKDTVDQILNVLKKYDIKMLDITGGAPEMNPDFTYLVTEAKKSGCHIVARSNLTIFFEKGFEYLSEFYSQHNIEISASLPHYLNSSVDRVRGNGTFEKSIRAMKVLNRMGYGDGSGIRKLNLVYNPAGAFLAPEQKRLEEEYRQELGARHGILFDNLLVFSNMPVGRFRNYLERTGTLGSYLEKLEQAFNPVTLDGLMCRHLISVGWDGALHDCDFNQVLGLHMHDSLPQHIQEFDLERLSAREINAGDHCYGCTAGQGST